MRPIDLDKVPNWPNKTNQEVLDYLTTPIPKVIPNARYTEIGLRKIFGKQKIVQWSVAIEAAAKAAPNAIVAEQLRSDLRALSIGEGPDFSDPETIAGVKALVSLGIVSKEDGDRMLALGTDSRTPWQRMHGETPAPTLQQVTAARNQRNLIDWFDARKEYVSDRIKSGVITSQQAASDAILNDVG